MNIRAGGDLPILTRISLPGMLYA
ncbi:MAG: hypothetical protein FD137_1125, partial [Spirochaetes bacterium]